MTKIICADFSQIYNTDRVSVIKTAVMG